MACRASLDGRGGAGCPSDPGTRRHGTTTVNVWSFGKGLPANTYTAGIQYVVSDVALVDARAKAQGVTITTPLGNLGAGLRTVWLGDPDGITNYFAQLMRNTQAGAQ